MLAIMFEMIRPFRCCWYFSAYSMASMPPHEWPSRKKLSRVEPQRLAHLLDLVDEARQNPRAPASSGWSL